MHCTVYLKALVPPRLWGHNGDQVVPTGQQQRYAVATMVPRHKSWRAFDKLAPSLQSMPTAMKEDIHFMNNLLEMVTPIQGTARLGPALELSSTSALPTALPQTFPMNLGESPHPLGAQNTAVTTGSYRAWSLNPQIILSLFHLISAPRREKMWQGKEREGRYASHIGLVTNVPSREGNMDASQLYPHTGQLSPYCLQQVFYCHFHLAPEHSYLTLLATQH